ncbi:MAG TPA: alpha/beta fold hydrolase [Candidatus Cybelea sp.]|nr:alpha/beta fold hydrolase [Candidatus Cybelea sp.]
MAETLPLILVPGLLCNADLWSHQVAHLGDVAVPMVSMEHTKHETIAAIAASILRDAPRRFHLAGLSMGGYVALELMQQAPERVARLALLDTSARADTAEQTAMRREMMAMTDIGQFKGVTPRLLPTLIHPSRIGDRSLVDRILAMAQSIGKDGYLRQQRAIISRVDRRADLPRIVCPTLVLCGEQDARATPEVAREIAAGISGAKLVLVPACGHLSTMERPEAVTAAMHGWLAA